MNEETIDLHELWIILKKKAMLIISVTLLITLLSGIITILFIKPKYKATVSLFINQSSTGTSGQDLPDINLYQKLVESYAKIAKSKRVSANVIEKLDLNMTHQTLQAMLSVSPDVNSQFINVSVTSTSRELTFEFANEVAYSTKSIGKELRGEDLVQILDEAEMPLTKDSPSLKLNVAIGFVLGLMLSIFYVLLREFLEKSIKSQKYITDDMKLNILATIPRSK